MTYQEVVKSHKKFSHQYGKMSLYYTLLSDHCNSIPSSRSVIHCEPLLHVNVDKDFGLVIIVRFFTFLNPKT